MSEQSLPAEARQFDFWIGDWDAVWGDNARGTNVVRAVLDNAVILENFDGRPGPPRAVECIHAAGRIHHTAAVQATPRQVIAACAQHQRQQDQDWDVKRSTFHDFPPVVLEAQ